MLPSYNLQMWRQAIVHVTASVALLMKTMKQEVKPDMDVFCLLVVCVVQARSIRRLLRPLMLADCRLFRFRALLRDWMGLVGQHANFIGYLQRNTETSLSQFFKIIFNHTVMLLCTSVVRIKLTKHKCVHLHVDQHFVFRGFSPWKCNNVSSPDGSDELDHPVCPFLCAFELPLGSYGTQGEVKHTHKDICVNHVGTGPAINSFQTVWEKYTD